MVIEDLLAKRGMTKYKLAVQAGIPHPTLSDICSGKTKLEKCSAETVYKLSQVLGVSMEQLTEDASAKPNVNAPTSMACRTICSTTWMRIKAESKSQQPVGLFMG